ncbi:benzoate 4-monooxygenase cytochrome P450 [Cercophora newfieldiana]|uniref:Benzoate 4-monooxygenase cytochrome P450 n=1 Tax=Cercophora newfieldiana TaxID=92897 RepID=A0AA39XTA3_9PEZI|nr:benzoate 4-monooxygenase cytochrome P450 [Cercophora newfieldiana]
MSFYVAFAVLAGLGYLINKYVTTERKKHGLEHFPGPLLCAISHIPYAFHFFAGDHPRWIESLHEKYGPVVRTAPNELSFISPRSWRDIYAYRKDHLVFRKSLAYDAAAFTDQTRSIVNEQDPAEHSKMRKMLAPAFSDRNLRLQWPLIDETVNTLIAELSKLATAKKPADLSLYFSLATFDVSASLALGEEFHSIEAGKLHPWAVFFKHGAEAMGQGVAAGRFPWLKKILVAVKPPPMGGLIKQLHKHEALCIEMVKKRQTHPSDRPDILGLILSAHEKEGNTFTTPFMAAQLSDVIIAGTETTALALSTAAYYVTRDAEVHRKLKEEIRGRFSSYEDISPGTVADLPYVNAVFSEAMRLMSPVPWPPSRVVPMGGDNVEGYHLPEGTCVSTSSFAAPRSERNFKDPKVFRPERWIEKDGVDQLDASQPFGLGPRACIGKSVGLTIARLILAKVFFKFDMEAVDKNLDWVGKTRFRLLWDKPKLWVQLNERE